jgi:hypothetical protein
MDQSRAAKTIQLAAFRMRALNLQDVRERLDAEVSQLLSDHEALEKNPENLQIFQHKMELFRRKGLRFTKAQKFFDQDWSMFEIRFMEGN